MNEEELTDVFRKLDAHDPELWAMSEIEFGVPQLARFLFLKGAWSYVVSDSEDWIEATLADYNDQDTGPYSGMMHSLKEMVDAGVSKRAITEFARCIGAEMIFNIGYLLDDPGVVQNNEYVSWGLFVTDNEGNPQKHIGGIHESVLETDPTGREMRPRD